MSQSRRLASASAGSMTRRHSVWDVCERSTRLPRGERSTTRRAGACGVRSSNGVRNSVRISMASPANRAWRNLVAKQRAAATSQHDDRRLVLRFRIAVFLSAMRATAAARGVDTASPGAVRSHSRCERPEGSRGNRRQARFHLSIRRVAGESAGHTVAVSACAPVQPNPAAASRHRVRLHARCDHADLPLRMA